MPNPTTRVSVAGATGWTGRPIAEAVAEADDLALVSAVARSAPGMDLGTAWGGAANVGAAVERGVAVVVGSSGLTAADYTEIDGLARARGVGVVAAGNFSLTAAMAQAAAALVARHLPQWEIIDHASADKRDARGVTGLVRGLDTSLLSG